MDTATFLGVSVIVLTGEEILSRVWRLDGFFAVLRTWVLGILLGIGFHFLSIGIFATPLLVSFITESPQFVRDLPLFVLAGGLGLLAAITANVGFFLSDLLSQLGLTRGDIVKFILEALRIRVP